MPVGHIDTLLLILDVAMGRHSRQALASTSGEHESAPLTGACGEKQSASKLVTQWPTSEAAGREQHDMQGPTVNEGGRGSSPGPRAVGIWRDVEVRFQLSTRGVNCAVPCACARVWMCLAADVF